VEKMKKRNAFDEYKQSHTVNFFTTSVTSIHTFKKRRKTIGNMEQPISSVGTSKKSYAIGQQTINQLLVKVR